MTLTAQPLADSPALDQVRAALNVNVASPERISSVAAGAALLLYGASRKSLTGVLFALVGGALIHRGSTGHCKVYEKFGIEQS